MCIVFFDMGYFDTCTAKITWVHAIMLFVLIRETRIYIMHSTIGEKNLWRWQRMLKRCDWAIMDTIPSMSDLNCTVFLKAHGRDLTTKYILCLVMHDDLFSLQLKRKFYNKFKNSLRTCSLSMLYSTILHPGMPATYLLWTAWILVIHIVHVWLGRKKPTQAVDTSRLFCAVASRSHHYFQDCFNNPKSL